MLGNGKTAHGCSGKSEPSMAAYMQIHVLVPQSNDLCLIQCYDSAEYFLNAKNL